MALNTTYNNQNICAVRPLTDVPENIIAFNDNCRKESVISIFIKNETSFSKRLVAFLFDSVFIGVLYILTYNFFLDYHNQMIVDVLYFLYPYFYYVCIPTLSKGTIGMLITNLRCIRSDGEVTEFTSYHYRFIALHFPMVLYLSLNLMMHSTTINTEFMPVIQDLKYYTLVSYVLWLGLCFLSVFLSPLKRGIYEKLSRTMVILYRIHQ